MYDAARAFTLKANNGAQKDNSAYGVSGVAYRTGRAGHFVSGVKFLARDSIYAIARYMPSPVRLSVRLSVCPAVCHTGGSVKDG